MNASLIVICATDQVIGSELTASLEQSSYDVHQVLTLEHCLLFIRETHPSLLMITVQADNHQIYRFLTECQENEKLCDIPILLVVDRNIEIHQYIDLKADDYLISPFSPQEVKLRIDNALHRRKIRKQYLRNIQSLEQEKLAMLEELEYQKKVSQELFAREMLIDKITGFPTTPSLMDDIRKILETGIPIDILYFSISKLKKVEEVFGWQIIDNVLEYTARRLVEIAKKTLTDEDILAIDRAAGDDFILFISSPQNYFKNKDMSLQEFGKQIIEDLRESLNEKFGHDLSRQFDFYIGTSRMYFNAKIRLERLVYNSIKEAVSVAINQEQRTFAYNVEKLNQIILEEKIATQYQPIVSTADLSILGFEAVSRGTTDEFLHQPELLFDLAHRADIVWQLERVCRRQALKRTRELPEGTLLFLNLDPSAAKDPHLRSHESLIHYNVNPSQIVFEITERTNIDDFLSFKKQLEYLRRMGFRIAIDDAGSGYSSLQSITELEPDFIKFDMTLVRDIHKTYIKQSLVEVLVKFSEKLKIPVIAEGVESVEEFQTIIELGVPLAQGYLFSRPCTTFLEGIQSVSERKERQSPHV